MADSVALVRVMLAARQAAQAAIAVATAITSWMISAAGTCISVGTRKSREAPNEAAPHASIGGLPVSAKVG